MVSHLEIYKPFRETIDHCSQYINRKMKSNVKELLYINVYKYYEIYENSFVNLAGKIHTVQLKIILSI